MTPALYVEAPPHGPALPLTREQLLVLEFVRQVGSVENARDALELLRMLRPAA